MPNFVYHNKELKRLIFQGRARVEPVHQFRNIEALATSELGVDGHLKFAPHRNTHRAIRAIIAIAIAELHQKALVANQSETAEKAFLSAVMDLGFCSLSDFFKKPRYKFPPSIHHLIDVLWDRKDSRGQDFISPQDKKKFLQSLELTENLRIKKLKGLPKKIKEIESRWNPFKKSQNADKVARKKRLKVELTAIDTLYHRVRAKSLSSQITAKADSTLSAFAKDERLARIVAPEQQTGLRTLVNTHFNEARLANLSPAALKLLQFAAQNPTQVPDLTKGLQILTESQKAAKKGLSGIGTSQPVRHSQGSRKPLQTHTREDGIELKPVSSFQRAKKS